MTEAIACLKLSKLRFRMPAFLEKMAPQSRGTHPQGGSYSQPLTSPTLAAFDATLSSPDIPQDERTPTGPVPNNYQETPATSPIDDPAVEEEEEDDADFQSHYSQNNNSDASDSDEDLPNGTGSPRPFFHSSNSSVYGPNAFAPPFYNRPPTPLPPSPSLTSLLRPPFSASTSRPTTPDSSDVETPNDTEAAVAKSARRATTVPRASPKVPTYEYYGFVLYLASSLAFRKLFEPTIRVTALTKVSAVIYLLWSYLPSPFLHQLGIYYYPNRWWSLAIPSMLVMSIIYIYVALASYNTGYLTLPMSSIENIVDESANIAIIDSRGRIKKGGSAVRNPGALPPGPMGGSANRKLEWRNVWNEGTDAVMDVPLGGVCEVLYGEGRDGSSESEGFGPVLPNGTRVSKVYEY